MNTYLEAFLSNDYSVIEQVYRKCYGYLLPVVRRENGTERDAKGVVQIILHVMFDIAKKKPEMFPSDDYFLKYCFTSCRNRWSRMKIGPPKTPTELIDFNDKQVTLVDKGELDIESSILENERWTLVYHHLQGLGSRCHSLIEWRIDGIKMKEIAAKMGWSGEQVAKNEVKKCLERLDLQVKSDPLYKKLMYK